MADRRVKVVFSAEIQNYKSAMEAAAKSTEKVKKASEDAGKASEESGKKSTNASKEAAAAAKAAAKAAAEAAKAESEAAKKRTDAIQSIGQTAAIGGAAVLAGVGLAVKSYADFDKQMSSVNAATHESAENMQLLRDAAVKAGADTAFSASDAARGIEEMAKAGVSTKDILGGGLNGALALAAAGSLDVGKAAEIAATAVSQFGLEGKDVPHVADLLAAGAGKAQGSVEDLSLALKYVGPVAAGMGVSIEETTGTLAAFAKQGIIGDNAGTALRGMLGSLTSPSKAAAGEIEKLGINLYDVDGKVTGTKGKFLGLANVAGQLQGAFTGMNDAQRDASLGLIFGNEQVTAARTLYKTGAEGIKEWTAAVDDAGFAADTASRKQNNLSGDLEKLGGSFDTVLIQSGSGANDVLRGLVQTTEGLVDAVGKVPGPVLGVATGLAAVVGGAALLGGGLITVIPKIAATREALDLLAPAGSRANAALSKTGKIAAGAATGLAAVAAASAIAQPALDNILKPTGETGDALEAFGGQAARGAVGADTLNKSFQDLVQHKEGVSDFQAAIEGIADPGLMGNIDNIVVGGIKILSLGMADVTSTSDKARERMKALGEQLASVDANKAAESFQDMARATDGSQDKLKQLLDLMPGYRAKLEEQAKASGFATDDQTLLELAMGKLKISTDGAATSTEKYTDAAGKSVPVSEELAKHLEEIGVSADGSVADLDKFTEAMFRATHTNLSARDAARGLQEAIDGVEASIKTNGTSLDINTEKGRANQAVLDKIANSGLAVVEANAKNGDSQKSLQGNLDATYQALIDGAGQFGITGTAAQDLARDVLNVPDGVDIKTWMGDEAKRMAEQTKAAVDGIPKHVTITIDTFRTTFEKLVGLPAQVSDGSAGQGAGVYAPGFLGPKKATGGRLPGFADGGQLPSTGPGTDTTDGFLGISSAGVPLARVDAGEWIINSGSSGRYNRELAAINAGTFPKLPGYADGGRAYAAQAFASRAGGSSGVTFDFSGAQFTALDPVQLRRDVVDEVTHTINTKGGMRIV